MGNDFLRVCDLGEEALGALFESARELAAAFRKREMPQLLRGKRVALSFEDRGFRNRVAFELGIRLMGGEAVFVPGRLGEGEAPGDIAKYLGNWFDAIVVRTPEFETIEEMARNVAVPMINARTRQNHPCEILGDLAFVQECRGTLQDLRVVFVGEPTNLCHSWFEAGVALPIDVLQVCPPGFEIDLGFYERLGTRVSGRLGITRDLETALKTADVVYTDCWPARACLESRETVERAFAPYRITAELLEQTPATCLFLPCPPVTRGEEVSDDALASRKCRVYDAKEFLLHAQNALLTMLLK